MLTKYGMVDFKPIFVFLDQNLKLSAHDGSWLENLTLYMGSLIYLSISSPYLNYTVGLESQIMQVPKKPQLDAMRCTF